MALNIASSCQESQAECCNKEGLLLFPSEMSLCKIQPSFSLLQPSSCYMQRGAKFIISGKKMANIFPRPWEKERTDCGSIIQEKTTGDILHEQQLAALSMPRWARICATGLEHRMAETSFLLLLPWFGYHRRFQNKYPIASIQKVLRAQWPWREDRDCDYKEQLLQVWALGFCVPLKAQAILRGNGSGKSTVFYDLHHSPTPLLP